MTPENFVYWLQGFAEVNKEVPTPEQWSIIKDHLQLLFKKETPDYNKNESFVIDTKHPNYPYDTTTVIC